MTQFSNVNGSGIVEQVRDIARVDSNQWSTQKITNSVNNWFDKVTGFAIGADTRFEWDDTNHTKLPIGTTDLIANQPDYSFLLDEQGNKIITLTSISLIEIATNKETKLESVNRGMEEYNYQTFGVETGTPTSYDKIADNVVKLDKKPTASDASQYKLKFYFQRTPSYFTAADTTKEPGVSSLLHRGFIIAGAYDCALSLGLANLQALGVELQKEEEKLIQYFSVRNNDEPKRMKPLYENNR
jgi:hypothetical protein